MISSVAAFANNASNDNKADTNEVKALNKSGFDMRFTNSNETINYAAKALALAQKLNFTNGIAEAYRVKGVGEYYQNKSDSAINDYLTSLNYFEQARNLAG